MSGSSSGSSSGTSGDSSSDSSSDDETSGDETQQTTPSSCCTKCQIHQRLAQLRMVITHLSVVNCEEAKSDPDSSGESGEGTYLLCHKCLVQCASYACFNDMRMIVYKA